MRQRHHNARACRQNQRKQHRRRTQRQTCRVKRTQHRRNVCRATRKHIMRINVRQRQQRTTPHPVQAHAFNAFAQRIGEPCNQAQFV